MVFPSGLLVHTADLETGETLGAADISGVKSTIKTYTTIKCRFGKRASRWGEVVEAGKHSTTTITCIVPAGTPVTPGRTLVGLSSPYTNTYRIVEVDGAELATTLSHLVLTLEVVNG